MSERATEFVAETLASWTALRTELDAAKPEGVRCFCCHRDSLDLAGIGPLRHVAHGLFVCPSCEVTTS